MTDLHDLLDRATDRLEAPHLAASAITTARRRRLRRRGAVVSLAVAGVVAATLLVPSRSPDVQPVNPTPSPSATRTVEAPPVPAAAIQPVWDPRTVRDLPRRNVLLPVDLLPRSSVDVSGARILALVGDGSGLWVVDDGERWQRYDYPEEPRDSSDSALSADGTRIFLTGRAGVWSRETSGGPWQLTPYPDGFDARVEDYVALLPEAGAVTNLSQGERSWQLDVSTGEVREHNFGLINLTRASDDVYVSFGVTRKPFGRTIVQEAGTASSSVPADALDYLQAPVADSRFIAATRTASSYVEPREGTDLDGLLALTRGDLRTTAYLPVLDEGGWYGEGGGLRALDWLADGSLLFSVIPLDTGGHVTGTRYLVTWDMETGELRLASQLPTSFDLSLAVDEL